MCLRFNWTLVILLYISKINELEVAIYNCEWYSASIPFKKMLLQFMTGFTTTQGIHAEPYYPTFDLMLLAKVKSVIWNSS